MTDLPKIGEPGWVATDPAALGTWQELQERAADEVAKHPALAHVVGNLRSVARVLATLRSGGASASATDGGTDPILAGCEEAVRRMEAGERGIIRLYEPRTADMIGLPDGARVFRRVEHCDGCQCEGASATDRDAALRELLKGFASHKSWCKAFGQLMGEFYPDRCNCGLREVLLRLGVDEVAEHAAARAAYFARASAPSTESATTRETSE